MSKPTAKVADFMTPHPHNVHHNENLDRANDIMTKGGFRHLPVMEGGKLVGIVSARDLQMAKGFKHGNLKSMTVGDVVEDSVYVTTPAASLKTVALEMAERKIGSAVVVEDDKPVGIFTTSDACRALAEVLA